MPISISYPYFVLDYTLRRGMETLMTLILTD